MNVPLLTQLYRDAVRTLYPAAAVRDALDSTPHELSTARGPMHIIALGKASLAMSQAALEWAASRGRPVLGGLCVTHEANPTVELPFDVVIGDHPTPGPHSILAADALGSYVASRVTDGDHVLVLLSGGTSALLGAPLGDITLEQYATTSDALLGAGLSINQINRTRRQLTRWGAGRLGDALQQRGADVEVLVISDVVGDDLFSIGSGPCMPDDIGVARPIPHRVISNNNTAREAIVRLAAERGLDASTIDDPLHGDVSLCAERITYTLLTEASRARAQHVTPNGSPRITPSASRRVTPSPRLFCWGGEPTVTLSGTDVPAGGRMQALALQIAKLLHHDGADARDITVLAAGTDGRDGATDAAGAIVDGSTWTTLRSVGRRPDADLAGFRSHDALAAVGALIPAFASGTNVNDVVIALVGQAHR